MTTLRIFAVTVVSLSFFALNSCCGCYDEEATFTPVATKSFTPEVKPTPEPAPVIVKKSKK